MLIALFHLLVGLLGLSLLYAALFLHETEEGRVQNRLEVLWVQVDDLSKTALSKQTAFLQQVSAMANSALNKLFGAKLFSAGAASASVSFSVGSFFLFFVYLGMRFGEPGFPAKFYAEAYSILLGAAMLSFLVGLLPVPFRYLAFLWFVLGIFGALFLKWEALALTVLEGSLVLCGGFLSDVLFVATSRWCLRKSAKSKAGWKITSFLILNGSLGLVLVSPLVLGGTKGLKPLNSGIVFLGASNLVTGAISLLFVLLALTALAHLAFWPVLERPIYSLQRFGVARKPKLLAAAAVTCLLFAWPHSPVVRDIAKLIHGGSG